MKNVKIFICTSVALSALDMMDVERSKEYIQKINDPEKIDFEIIKTVPNSLIKFKEPKRNFVNKFNKNQHRK